MSNQVILFPIAPDELYKNIRALIVEVVEEKITGEVRIPDALSDRTMLTPKEVCAVLRISRPTLYTLIKEKQLPTFTIQTRRYFARTDIEKFINQKRF